MVSCGIQGNFLAFVKNFMSNRTFQVRVNGINSKTKHLQNGIPQGSTLSPTLFLLAINNIAQEIELPLKANLYADDLIVYTRSCNISLATEILQAFLHKLKIGSHKSSFTFSSEKTYFIIFSKNKTNSKPTLILNDINIKQVDSTDFLGLRFDSHLKWTDHIKKLALSCQPKINLLKILSNRNWGKLGFTASKKILKVLDVIQSASLRLVLDAFRTSPVASLQATLNKPPLFIRRQYTTLRYAAKLYSNINNPNYLLLHTNNTTHKSNRQSRYLTFKELVMNCGYNTNLLTYLLSTYPAEPPWTINTPTINTSLVTYPKNTTNLTLVRTLYKKILSKYDNYVKIFTDASKTKNSCAAAFLTYDIEYAIRILTFCSLFTGEAIAILKALEFCQKYTDTNLLFISDSLSVLQIIKQVYPTHKIIQNIKSMLYYLQNKNINIHFHWIPSHIGISGNEKVDALAVKTTSNERIDIIKQIPVTDIYRNIKQYCTEVWQRCWDSNNSNFKVIKPSTGVRLQLPEKKKKTGGYKSTTNWSYNINPSKLINEAAITRMLIL
ncbi:uncharacterized protein [Diabrotica undecimpunctata]|uniref:uncharacterized protein n=1 Tax=Diabrotica undecimpunctata TaxID=50387 RepID=UPI003B63737D